MYNDPMISKIFRCDIGAASVSIVFGYTALHVHWWENMESPSLKMVILWLKDMPPLKSGSLETQQKRNNDNTDTLIPNHL